jgi:hypothetical protein
MSISRRFLQPINLLNSTNDPVSAVGGDVYYNSVINKIKFYDGSTWITLDSGGTGIQNIIEDLSPELGGNLDALSNNITNIDNLSFDLSPDNLGGVGSLVWNDGEGTLDLGLKGGNVTLNLGQEEVALCYNGTGSTLTNGTVVYISGAQGQRPSIAKSSASGESTSSKTFGVVIENIANGQEGFVATFGVVRGLNTSAYAEGAALWLSTTAGQITTTMPTQPNHSVFIGYCVRQHSTSGQIFVKIQNGYELEELHNVLITSPTSDQVLGYDSNTGLWKNIDQSGGTVSGIVESGSQYPDEVPSGTLFFNTSTLSLSYRIGESWLEVGSVAPIDGGLVATVEFVSELNGGAPSSTNDFLIDGGIVVEEQIELLA